MRKLVVNALIGTSTNTNKLLPKLKVERIVQRQYLHYDYATNAAHLMSSDEKGKQLFIDALRASDEIEEVYLTKNNFVNIRVKSKFIERRIESIYSYSRLVDRESLNIEYVSANPTAPLHVGNVRWAVYGDVLSALFRKCGYSVVSEYYVNDRGRQIDVLLDSLSKLQCGLDAAEALELQYYSPYLEEMSRDNRTWDRESVVEYILKRILSNLERLKTRYNHITYETSLYVQHSVDELISKMLKEGDFYRRDGAVFFKTTSYGDEKDRVVVKGDGEYTYFMSDILYFLDKISRGFKRIVIILGADHHGYVKRMEAAHTVLSKLLKAESSLSILVGQLIEVKTLSGGRGKMSKRMKNVVTLDELNCVLDADCIRYRLLRQPLNNFLVIDTEKLQNQGKNEKLYYVQYAYARIRSLIRLYENKEGSKTLDNLSLELPEDEDCEHERKLFLSLLEYRDLIEEVVTHNDRLHMLIYYIEDLCRDFHAFYEKKKILIWEKPPLVRLRMCLVYKLYRLMNQVFELFGIEKIESL